MVPGSETFSLFFNADIRTAPFSADVLKKCALVALHVVCGRRKRRRIWRSCPWSGRGMENGLPKESNVGE